LGAAILPHARWEHLCNPRRPSRTTPRSGSSRGWASAARWSRWRASSTTPPRDHRAVFHRGPARL